MILTEEGLSQRTDFLVKELDPDHFGLCEAMVVKLEGGVAAGAFTGSGVVFRIDLTAGQTYILTAKHNLHIAAKRAALDRGGLEGYFRTKVGVVVEGTEGTSRKKYPIAAISFPDGSDADYRYDVCLLRIDSAELTREVNRILGVGFRGEFASTKARSGLWRDLRDKQIWDVLTNDVARRVLTNAFGYRGYTLLQFGYGKNGPSAMASHVFAKRTISIEPPRGSARVVHSYLPVTHEKYQDVFVFPGSDENTGAPGDSGGPVFALDPTLTKAFLIGLHLGANFYADKTDNNPNSATVNNAFTVLSSDRLGVDAYALERGDA